jgi:hypothetical protein
MVLILFAHERSNGLGTLILLYSFQFLAMVRSRIMERMKVSAKALYRPHIAKNVLGSLRSLNYEASLAKRACMGCGVNATH